MGRLGAYLRTVSRPDFWGATKRNVEYYWATAGQHASQLASRMVQHPPGHIGDGRLRKEVAALIPCVARRAGKT